ncbi:MAG TPA: 30S ribosomal protein S20 [Victivallales bacterium]|nr:30S ribosomal protein S20 [Victivallales bacterium]HPO90773.1 30S ribosomal protein S20 [Victivallales bacterium]HRR05677.1 30S ribosomal protein S20 [Victivallales bacterium]HRR28832.1 30S ribosomal protein S20 [Victivallales bacterium]HRU00518.1 30S ribosomal protein S20 [Victivallales bacterium]
MAEEKEKSKKKLSSAHKRAKQAARRTTMNKARKSELWSIEKNIRSENDPEKKKKLLSLYFSRLDKAVKANAIKRGKASRKKSRLSKLLAKTP